MDPRSLLATRPARALAALLTLAALASPIPASAQAKRALTHEDYDGWNRIEGPVLTRAGDALAYELRPGDGDATLVLRALEGGDVEHRFARGTGQRFSSDGRWLVFRVRPHEAAVDSAKRAKKRGDDLPQDSLIAVRADDGSTALAVADVRSFALPEEGAPGRLAYLLVRAPEPDSAAEAEGAGAGAAKEKEKEKEKEEPAKSEEGGGDEAKKRKKDRGKPGTPLVLHDLTTGSEHRYEHVTWYRFSKDGERLFYVAVTPDGAGDGVYRVETATGAVTPLATGEGRYRAAALDEEGRRVAFLTDRDDREADEPAFSLYVDGRAVVAPGAAGMPDGWWIGPDGSLRFSRSGERVLFGTQPRPEPEPEDDTLDEDKVRVDVWSWTDDYMMPMQLLRADQERKRTYLAWVPADGGTVTQLGSPEVPDVTVGAEGDGAYAVGTTDLPYRQELSWDGRYADVYLIDVATGERQRVLEHLRGGLARLSPEGRYLWWWDQIERAWYALDARPGARTPVNLTAALPYPVHDLLNDRPQPPGPAAFPQWSEDDRWMIVYDEFDAWRVDPNGRTRPEPITDGVGRERGIRFRYASVDRDEDAVPLGRDVLFSAFDTRTKASGFYRDRVDGRRPPERLVWGDVRYSTPTRAADADRLLFTRESFTEFPDLWVAGADLDGARRVSDANPQQAEVRWGTAELVEWTSNDGIPLQGILYKPEDFDPEARYPMMVYFYERMSDGLHRHQVPAAGGSSINFSFYVSRGYVVFVPDIPYEVGHPGESALDAVVPGVLSVVERGFVDPARIGVQGHSWGGYQIAYMITRTNLFAAAEAGAPVVNMTSAYGGIRWGSGMVRQFQYERTQSRIGGSLWERPLLYLENSPLFAADKIRTPLLMMHNDEDTAVPWYQGIEMFAAMRRLQKPVWLINYNGEPHGLRREPNRKDWAVRMQQFFDHYLMDAPPPEWMVHGVPAVQKGRTLGLELVTEAATQGGDGPGGR